ncbi:MAG: phosphotransferase [Halioglobus sp.]
MSVIVTRPDDVTTQWMSEALANSGHLDSGIVVSWLSYDIIGTGKMGDNARFVLEYSGDHHKAPESVIIKFPAEDETARAMAGAQGAYYNEVMFYRHLADKTAMRTPAIYVNEVSDDRLMFVTAMEDMSPAEPGSQLVGESLNHVRVAMGEAAKLAAAFYGDESVGAHDFVMSQIRDDGGAFGQALLQQYWPGFLERFGHGISEESQAFGAFYVDNHTRFATRFDGPRTLAHGDFRSENILFDGDRACTVDWQTTSEASPLTDLAYFMGGSVDLEDRRAWEKEIVQEYSALLNGLGVNLEFEACWQQYREQAMHGLMITILGASFTAAAERSDAMFLTMIQRHLQHCVDLGAQEFLE